MCAQDRQPAILCIGEDRRLLETRCNLLRTRYASVRMTMFAELLDVVDGEFDFVVLCHSIHRADYEVCVAFARQRWKDARIVRVVRESGTDLRDSIAIVGTHPAVLLQGFERMTAAVSTAL